MSKVIDKYSIKNYNSTNGDIYNVYVSAKLHGTSGRSGYVPYDDRSILQRFFKVKPKYRWVKGTRNVVHNPNDRMDSGYYANTTFRDEAHNLFIPNLLRDEVVYYEIVGYCGPSTKIMPDHHITDKELKESGFSKEDIKEFRNNYGDTISYVYGCEPGDFDVYIYRITQNGKDLSNSQMIARSQELGLKTVPQLLECTSDQDLMKISERLSREADMDGQMREGVCLRLEDKDGNLVKIVKYKSFLFCLAEQIKKNTDSYIDLEEVS